MLLPIGSHFQPTAFPALFSRLTLSFEDIGVTTLTFLESRDVLLVWPLDSQYGISYRWSVWTDCLSRMVVEIFDFKDIGVTTLIFGVTWRHRWCDHWTRKVRFPIGSQYEPTMYLAGLLRYWASKILGSRPWPFRVTWRHLSCDHWTPDM